MKKRFTILGVLLFLMAGVTMGQNYQMPNNTFESWSSPDLSSERQVPTGWHSFSDAEGLYANLSSTNYSGPRAGHNGNYCCMIKSHKVFALTKYVNANGSLTTGQIMITA